MNSTEQPPTDAAKVHRTPSPTILIACILFIAANIVVPLTLGDVYPFTIAPMFEDAPRKYSNLRVLSPTGEVLADNSTRRIDPITKPDPFLLRRYYDGNPVGVGVGIEPPKTIDEFGQVPSIPEVREWIEQRLVEMPQYEFVDVQQQVVSAVDERRVGILEMRTFRVDRPGRGGP